MLKLIAQRLPEALAAAVHDQVQVTEATIATPYPPASMPGNPPHFRKGYLYLGLVHWQTADTSSYVETVLSSRPGGDDGVPQALEFGHGSVAPRPYMEPMRSRMRADLLPGIASRMRFS